MSLASGRCAGINHNTDSGYNKGRVNMMMMLTGAIMPAEMNVIKTLYDMGNYFSNRVEARF